MIKKLFALLLVCCMAIAAGAACGRSDNLIRLSEVTHSVFYLPQYVALANGYFGEEGLEIELTNAGGADKVMTALISGAADIGLCGAEAAIYVYLEGKTDHAVVWGQLTKRDGSFLVGRNAEPNFDFSTLAGKEIIAGRRGGMPAMTLQYTLEQVYGLTVNTTGKTAGQVYLNFDIDFNNNAGAFAGGVGDYVALFEPAGSQLAANGQGHLVASIGAAGGLVPYTAYQSLKSYYNKNGDKIKKFLRAVDKGLAYINSSTADHLAELILPQFAGSTKQMLAAAIANFKTIDVWNATPAMAQADFERLQDIMQNAGELSARVPFDKLIYNGYAETIG